MVTILALLRCKCVQGLYGFISHIVCLHGRILLEVKDITRRLSFPIFLIYLQLIGSKVHLNCIDAIDVDSSIGHHFEVLSPLQVPELVEETELSLLYESFYDGVKVLLGCLSVNRLAFVEHLNVDYPLFSLDGFRQIPHTDHYYEECQ